MTMFPLGYGSQLVTLDELQARHAPKMHPEFDRRIWPWLESMGGLIGIGGGWRSTQPTKPGFAPDGKSFHQSQSFRSGIVAYCALDLVARTGGVHRAPTWAESATAPQFGLHTFITGEPWHIQPIEIRGWQSWVNAGRPDPDPVEEDDIMRPPTGNPRVLDTRNTGQRLTAGTEVAVPVGKCRSALINLTVTNTTGAGFAVACTRGHQLPPTSNVNWSSGGQTIANAALVFPDAHGFVTVAVPVGSCDLIVDVQGVN